MNTKTSPLVTTFFFLTLFSQAQLNVKDSSKLPLVEKRNAAHRRDITIANTISDTPPINYVKKSDVEKILGEAASLTDSSTEKTNKAVKHRFTYTADHSETGSGKTAHLYCMFEKYADEQSAKNTYANIISQNQNMPNLTKINNVGDEAFRHTDNLNFDMMIVRKGNKIIRLKVNKLTATTSTKELQLVMQKVTQQL